MRQKRMSFGRHLGKIFLSDLKKRRKERIKETQKEGSPPSFLCCDYLGEDIILGAATAFNTLPPGFLLWGINLRYFSDVFHYLQTKTSQLAQIFG